MPIPPELLLQGVGLGLQGAGIGYQMFGGQGGPTGSQIDDQRFMNDFAWKQALRNEQYQRNYMQVRAADAEKAGFHPLAALGVNVGSGPQQAAFAGTGPGRPPRDTSGMQALGQNLSRAQSAMATEQEKIMNELAIEQAFANIDKTHAEAAFYRSNKITAGIGQNPAIPDPYGGANMTGDIRLHPTQHQIVRTPYGYRYEWSPEFVQANQGRMFTSAVRDLGDFFAGPEATQFYRNAWSFAKTPFQPGPGIPKRYHPRRPIPRNWREY